MAKTAYSKGIPVFTDFLSMNEISILHTVRDKLAGVHYKTYGGYEFAERQMAVFVPDALFCDAEDVRYPVTMLKIEPVHKKFAEKLSHRDYLGAMLGLGIERSQLGDILIQEDRAYVYCCTKMADFIKDGLSKVRNTFVQVDCSMDTVAVEPHFREVRGTVASLRADAVMAMVYKKSRAGILDLFRSQKVFVNGRLTESNSHLLKAGDIVSVRGYGRFVFAEVLSVTRKNRYSVVVNQY